MVFERMDTNLIKEKLKGRPIILVGMMGCGKSHVAKLLGRDLGFDVYDVDSVIESEEGRSITQIFEDEGEGFFRDLEAEKILALLERGECVIASGGGALMRPATLDAVLDKSLSIWINTDVDVLLERVKDDTMRPLMVGKDLRKKLLLLLAARLPFYGEADIYVENNGSEADVMDEIGHALEEFL